jgi:hypothetical protein
MLYNRRLMLRNHPHAGHSRIAIRVHKVDVAANKYVPKIVTTRHKSEGAEKRDERNVENPFQAFGFSPKLHCLSTNILCRPILFNASGCGNGSELGENIPCEKARIPLTFALPFSLSDLCPSST